METRKAWKAFLIGMLVAISGVALQLTLRPFVPITQYVLYFPLIIIGSIYGGSLAGIIATLLSSLFSWPLISTSDASGLKQFFPPVLLMFSGLLINNLVKRLDQARKNTEHSNEILKRLIEQSPFSMALLDTQMECIYASKKYKSQRPTKEEIINNNPEKWKEIQKKCLSGETLESDGERFRYKNGTSVWISWKAIPWYEQSGKIGGIIFSSEDITVRKTIEEDLLKRTSELESILDNTPIGLAFFDREHRYVRINKALAEINGLSRDKQIGRRIKEVLPQIFQKAEAIIEKVFETGQFIETEFTGETQKEPGNLRNWTTGFYPVFGHTRKPFLVGGYAIETTEWKRIQDELKHTEERSRLAQQVAKVGTFEWNIQKNVNKWTPELEALYGLKPNTFNGTYEHWKELIHPDDLKLAESAIRKAFETGDFRGEWRVIWPDGTVHWIAGRGSVEKDSEGKPVRMLGINIDITGNKMALERLKESEKAFRATFDLATVGIATVDLEGHWIKVNNALIKMFGYQEDELRKLTFVDITHPDDIQISLDQVNKLLRGEIDFYNLEKRYVRKGGAVIWVNLAVSLKRDERGRAEYYIACISDLSEPKKTQLALQEALRARDEFISIASHELKTPLTSLKLQAQMFKRSAEKNDSRIYKKEYVDPIIDMFDRQTDRLNRLVEDMLDVSRIRSGKIKINKESVELSQLVKETIRRMKTQFRDASIPLPIIKRDTDATGYWDRMKIEQVLNNLFTNAIKYGEHRSVEIEMFQEGSFVHLIITDHGIGISKTNQEKIFDRFERAIRASEVSGLGLGLFITKQIILAHNGRIWVKSELGKGSAFHVLLPVEEPSVLTLH